MSTNDAARPSRSEPDASPETLEALRCRRGRPRCAPPCATEPSSSGCSSCRRARFEAPRTRAFPLLVPRGFVARMRKRDPHDPLLKQVWPHAPSSTAPPASRADPVREQGLATQGVIRKYRGRVLLIASGACPLHCRYCFRREFPYAQQLAARADWSAALAALRDAGDVQEAS